MQEFAYENRVMSVLVDTIVESDEVFINRRKRARHANSQDPPRVRANKKKG